MVDWGIVADDVQDADSPNLRECRPSALDENFIQHVIMADVRVRRIRTVLAMMYIHACQ
jgi:hypothetical protein